MKIGVLNCTGHYGKEILRLLTQDKDIMLSGAGARIGNKNIGNDIGTFLGEGPMGISITSNINALCSESDVVIDFSHPDALSHHLSSALQGNAAYVTGTTGYSQQDIIEINKASQHIPVLKSSNMSLGATYISALTEILAKKLDSSFDIEIIDFHHRRKLDAPSGTALDIGKKAATARGLNFEENVQFDRSSGQGRKEGSIGFASLRGGSVVADCTIVFAGNGERIELTHRADSNIIFSLGAIKAAKWLSTQQNGLYTINDVFF